MLPIWVSLIEDRAEWISSDSQNPWLDGFHFVQVLDQFTNATPHLA